MIKREMYMKRIRPFIGTELIKVMTGIRRCGKSVMLELIKEELVESGISSAQFISINFEDLNFSLTCIPVFKAVDYDSHLSFNHNRFKALLMYKPVGVRLTKP